MGIYFLKSKNILSSVNVCSHAFAYSIAKTSPTVIYVMDINDSNLSNLAENIIDTTGVKCIPKRMDASSEKDIQSVIAGALKKYSRPDFYYASAGIGDRTALTEHTKYICLLK